MLYEDQFQKVHDLLKDYGCKPTFTFEPEYLSPVILGGSRFYQPQEEINGDQTQKEWRESVDAKLDVCVPTKMPIAARGKIRFDIEWSQKARLYSMYVSLPTSMRSVSLTRKRFKTQEELILEVGAWLTKGCKKAKISETKQPEARKTEQLSLF